VAAVSRGRLVQARYVPRSPAVPPCFHTAHVSRPPRARGRLWSGLVRLAQATVLAVGGYAMVLAILLAGASR
jgi:hypothetical protein